jgi:hypothetical protein
VRFSDLKLSWRGKDYYASAKPESEVAAVPDLAQLLSALNEKGSAFLTA